MQRTTQWIIKLLGLSVSGSRSQEILVPDVTLSVYKTKLIARLVLRQKGKFISFKSQLFMIMKGPATLCNSLNNEARLNPWQISRMPRKKLAFTCCVIVLSVGIVDTTAAGLPLLIFFSPSGPSVTTANSFA